MRLGAVILSMLLASPALACVPPLPDERTPGQARGEGVGVSVDGQCRMINGGIYDYMSLGRADDLGNGLVMQQINESPSMVLLADCNTREATILHGYQLEVQENPCGYYRDERALSEIVSFTSGADLHSLVDTATGRGADERNPLEFFFTFELIGQGRFDVARRDRFDLLCGCGIFYPDSPGAS